MIFQHGFLKKSTENENVSSNYQLHSEFFNDELNDGIQD